MKRLWMSGVLLLLSFSSIKNLQAAAGDLDPLFDGDGSVFTDIASTSDVGYRVIVQPDGKIIVVGNALNNSGQNNMALVRYNPNGSLDPTFGTGGIVSTSINNLVSDLVLQSDGKILVSTGGFIFRFNPNGSVDPTFGSGGNVSVISTAIALQSDGKILTAGSSANDFAVIRLNPNGSLDPTFGSGGQVTSDLGGADSAYDIGVQPDSKIVAFGMTNQAAAVVRYNPNGSLDPTFGSGGIVTTLVPGGFFTALKIQIDGRILIGGDVQDESIVDGGDSDFAMLRYNPNGTPDPTFGTNGQIIHDIGDNENFTDFDVQSNGKIVAIGTIIGNTSDFALLRCNSNGSPDITFGNGGIVTTDFSGENDSALAVTIQSDGFIIVAGTSRTADDDFAVARYEGDLIILTCNRYIDVFEDSVLATDWTYVKPAWSEAAGSLIGTPTGGKAEAIATPAFAGCSTAPCTFQTSIQTAGGVSNKIFFFGWFQDKQNTVEVLMKEQNDKWVLRQRAGGVVVAKTKSSQNILPNVSYDVKVDF
ncbi:MAG TPA: hypothetical protein VH815_01955, partial [Acidobacteriota bacterium]